jgi:hypothetical protein
MFKQVVNAGRQMLFLLRDTEQNKNDIAALKEQLAETNQLVRELAFELRHVAEHEQHEREKFMLKVENTLLRHEQLLPAAKESKKRK